MEKKALRQWILRRLREQPAKTRLAKSRIIGRKVCRLPSYRRAKTILCYVAIGGEVETRPLLSQAIADGKRVAVPATVGRSRRIIAVEIRDPERDLKKAGSFGVPQPARPLRRQLDLRKLDLILVPGVAFDRKRGRLGRGGGHFDRFLGKLPADVPSIGLAFRFQIIKRLPWEPHDRAVSRVITD